MADHLVMIDIVEGEVVTCLLVRCSHLSRLTLSALYSGKIELHAVYLNYNWALSVALGAASL